MEKTDKDKAWEEMLRRDAIYEAKKAKERENRLKKIQALISRNIKEIVPEDADKYEIVYRQVKKQYFFGKRVEVLPEHSPSYEFYLVSKSNPKEAYLIMNVLRPDIDARVKLSDMRTYYQIPALQRSMQEGMEYFKTGKLSDKFRKVRLALEKG